MQDYIELNHLAYDTLAEEYYDRLIRYDDSYRFVGKRICEMIFDYIVSENLFRNKDKINTLELGCGPGAILQVLREHMQVKSYAIDFSEKMTYYARRCNEKAKIVTENVLDIVDIDSCFAEKLQGNIDVVIMAAFIHLFSIDDARIIMNRIKEWLSPNGLVYLDTTKEPVFRDGEIKIKELHEGKEIMHFRTLWKKEEFNNFLHDCGYTIVAQHEHLAKGTGKIWIRTIIRCEK